MAWAWVRCRGLPVVDPRPRRPPANTPGSGEGSEATVSFVQRGGTRCVCGVGVGGRTLSRGEIGRWGVEVSCDRTGCSFGMAVGMAAPHSLTHLAVVRPSPGRLGSLLLGASRSTSLPCAPLPFAFLAQPDGRLSRNFLISREKTPAQIGYFHTEMFLAKAATIRDVHNGLGAWRRVRN